ncbi:hypothetical protein BYT27DRAFT_7208266 [Phlegmacium glaucopus]|nr:hypothetical protein BYT27DRAFT_7208266 [Phlegmacium glaucopus]
MPVPRFADFKSVRITIYPPPYNSTPHFRKPDGKRELYGRALTQCRKGHTYIGSPSYYTLQTEVTEHMLTKYSASTSPIPVPTKTRTFTPTGEQRAQPTNVPRFVDRLLIKTITQIFICFKTDGDKILHYYRFAGLYNIDIYGSAGFGIEWFLHFGITEGT